MNGLRTASHQPHHILQAPGQRKSKKTDPHTAHGKRQVHPPHSSYHRRFQSQPAVLPVASQRENWKTPYSYGYFGASSSRHWSLHHGYRDRQVEWRLK
ncbi:MAG: hypothetical protein AB8B91_06705 [Rubripirellula sp.]